MRQKHTLKRNIALWMMASFIAMPLGIDGAGNSTVGNDVLPGGGHFIAGGNDQNIIVTSDHQMNITQSGQNAVIKWDQGFNIGANAAVNFNGPNAGYHTLNYDAGGSMSQIYGKLNANNSGNIYIVNPNGVQIGNSAQINVGSLYVSNQKLDDAALRNIAGDFDKLYTYKTQTNAELMSLGHITAANKVTFVGDRVVIDMDRIAGNDMTNVSGEDIILGYTDIDDFKDSKVTLTKKDETVIQTKDDHIYKWIKNLDDLQGINENLGINYALRNAIDAVSTKDNSFTSIGSKAAFTGKFDGLGFGIYGLTIHGDNQDPNNGTGLFAKTDSASIRNLELVGGSVTGHTNVGAVVGLAENGTVIENIVSSMDVTGETNVGGIVGNAKGEGFKDAEQNDTRKVEMNGLVNTGTTKGHENVGGLIGKMTGSELEATASASGSYSLGAVYGMRSDEKVDSLDEIRKNDSTNIGGLVGYADNSKIGSDNSSQVFNQLDVKGGTNVGGIVGQMSGNTIIENAANYGTVTATGFNSRIYFYHGNTNGAYTDDVKEVTVNEANAGGIVGLSSGGRINHVVNEGDIRSVEVSPAGAATDQDTFYIAGNIGGIVGSATGTHIKDAENKENEIRGAHNVGGIAGYYTGQGTISNSVNNGGDIMGTGARDDNGKVVEEGVRDKTNNSANGEKFIIGNIGGIVGYMYGDDVRVDSSANRGTIHSKDIENDDDVKQSSQAANVGGIAGKIDRTQTKMDADSSNAAISNSYNTGDIRGFTGIGGIAGMMYNGEIVGSYNSGFIRTTRKSTDGKDTYTVINMGGIVGDTTEETKARVLIKDSYNKGTIGDKDFTYKGRHVGGIVGRLAGDVINSYNKGDIYNGYAVTGGIAGWWTAGTIENVFNTGNITVLNHDSRDFSQVGGIVGGTGSWKGKADTAKMINNAYNLGVLRSFRGSGAAANSLGGIVGSINWKTDDLQISNVYTTGDLYIYDSSGTSSMHSIYGNAVNGGKAEDPINAYYIESNNNAVHSWGGANTGDETMDGQATTVKYEDRFKADIWTDFIQNSGDDVWRIYDGTTPILNAFKPQLATDTSSKVEIGGVKFDETQHHIQFGTAYNPFLSIFKDGGDVVINDAGGNALANTDSVAVYGGSLLIEHAENNSNTMYSGILYADGELTLKGASGADIKLGSISGLYGSSVTIETDGDVTIYGTVTATGANGASNVTITSTDGDIEIIGAVTSVGAGDSTTIDGIDWEDDGKDFTGKNITDMNAAMPTTGSQYQTTATSKGNGDVVITGAGDVDILYGNKGTGYISTAGDLTVTSETGDVYMDSDLSLGGNLTLTSGEGQEAVLDISSIGKHYAETHPGTTQNDGLHEFLQNFSKPDANGKDHTIKIDSENAKIAVDMWDGNDLDLDKYDHKTNTDDTLSSHLNGLNVTIGKNPQSPSQIKDYVYIWVSDADQLAAIQTYAENHTDSHILSYNFALKHDIDASGVSDYTSIGGGDTAFSGTFDGRDNRITGLTSEKGGLFGTLTGIVKDLKVYNSNFEGDVVGAIANINKGTISGITTFGNEVTNSGKGMSVSVANGGGTAWVTAAGGIAGINEGKITDSSAADVVIAHTSDMITGSDGKTEQTAISTAGGIAGINASEGHIENVGVSSAVVATDTGAYSIGGAAGINADTAVISDVSSHGVTNGNYSKDEAVPNVGGIVGANAGNAEILEVYNESITSGRANVGGVAGWNESTVPIQNAANAGHVFGIESVGGLVGTNGLQQVGKDTEGSFEVTINGETRYYKYVNAGIENGRNAGTIEGTTHVGGLVGSNGEQSQLTNLENSASADITGITNVGGIAGTNMGTITGGDGLTNEGAVTGHTNVGGVAGANAGTILDMTSKIHLNVNPDGQGQAQFFGGIAGHNTENATIQNSTNSGTITSDSVTYVGGITGQNDGTIIGVTNTGRVDAKNSSYVGGIVGLNTKTGRLEGKIHNTEAGTVFGKENVGGIAGKNDSEKFAEGTELRNDGKVEASDGGAGGIFYENTAALKEISMINTGSVRGKNNTGGIIGLNSGTVTGGQGQGAHGLDYYKYQIINNGTVDGTKNAGGLIGMNNGSLTAGYNTGSVTSTGNNVGGVVGNNAGTADQVFSALAKDHTVSGSSNVGGIIGNNSGTLSNAYAAHGVTGNGIGVGNAVGTNSGTISNIYSAVTSGGKLIGETTGSSKIEHAYSFVEGDNSATQVISENDRNDHGSYDGFDFIGYDFEQGTVTEEGAWKNYDGHGSPVLSVFLTHTKWENGQLVSADDGKAAEATGGIGHSGLWMDTHDSSGQHYWSNQIEKGYLGYLLPDYELALDPEGPRLDYFLQDAPWDRQKNFRERKAELLFVLGGMTVDENRKLPVM